MLIKINKIVRLILLAMLPFLFSSVQNLQAQNCDNGALGWPEMSNIFSIAGCANCHGGAGGFNLNSYATFVQGGNKCGSAVTQNDAFLNVITVDAYDGCSTAFGGRSMNRRVNGALDSLDLLLIQRWINAGIPELCENFCIEDEIITLTLDNQAYHFGVDNSLTANNLVSNNSTIVYEAGTTINLDIGFEVDALSDFHAFIGACN